MRKIIILFLFLAFAFLAFPAYAYDPLSVRNNIYGIGIINHSDLEDVSDLVNSNGGDWGYVTIVITEKERDKKVWQNFFDECRRLHLIPIIRVATKFDNQNWQIPKLEEIDSWVSFFNSLNWVVENRYIIIANEPNHAKEWGGKIDPESYALYLKTFSQKLKNSNPDYFVLNAAFDQAANDSKLTMDQAKYINLMLKKEADVFKYIDGWASHSYPNPAFSGDEKAVGRKSIRGYEWELNLIKRDLPIFITETGWVRINNSRQQIEDSMRYAFEEVWSKDKRIVAVTPFILNYQNEPFYGFSWKNKDNSFFPVYDQIKSLEKTKGNPTQKISGEIVFNFLNPIMFKNSQAKGFSIVKNTGQAIWTQSEAQVMNESNNEIEVFNTKFVMTEPFKNTYLTYSLKTPESGEIFDLKLGFYVSGIKVGDLSNSKIISF